MPSLDELRSYPKMTRWFNPALLSKLLLRVIISDVFGQYADRRLLEAALDPRSPTDFVDEADITNTIVLDQQGAVWVDFVADLGDGFDATYAIARCWRRTGWQLKVILCQEVALSSWAAMKFTQQLTDKTTMRGC